MPEHTKEIWVPTSELNVRVQGHHLEIYEHMTMTPRPLQKAFFNTPHGDDPAW